MNEQELVPMKNLQKMIFTIRGIQVMIDRDLAELYQVENKRLNEQVKRNIARFPESFRFQLSDHEKNELVANCDRFEALKHSTANPYAFTEQGVSMLSAVQNGLPFPNLNPVQWKCWQNWEGRMKSEVGSMKGERKNDLPELSFGFARRIVLLCRVLDEKPEVIRTLANQLLRSGTSVGAKMKGEVRNVKSVKFQTSNLEIQR